MRIKKIVHDPATGFCTITMDDDRELKMESVRWDGNLPFILAAAAKWLSGSNPLNVVSLGCGFGQVEQALPYLLNVNSLIGIDANPAQVDKARVNCPEGKFEVANLGDMDAVLAVVGEGTANLVLGTHVTSELSPQALEIFFQIAAKALAPDGIIVLEGLSVQCLEYMTTHAKEGVLLPFENNDHPLFPADRRETSRLGYVRRAADGSVQEIFPQLFHTTAEHVAAAEKVGFELVLEEQVPMRAAQIEARPPLAAYIGEAPPLFTAVVFRKK